MPLTLNEIAALVHGQVVGDGHLAIANARILTEALPGDITFVENEKHATGLHQTQASAAVVPPSMPPNGIPLIRVADPLAAFAAIVRQLHGRPEPVPEGIHPRASVHRSAVLGEGCEVSALATIGEGTVLGRGCRIHGGAVVGRYCRLGEDVTLFPNAVLYDGTVLGNRVIVHANAVIGADGFGYRLQEGKHVKVPQLGNVEVGDDCEIGACSTIDRGTFGPTRIGAGTKIDNLVQVGHNCRIGLHNILVSQVGIGGSTSTGDYVVIAGQAGIVDHIHIGDRAVIGAKAGVTKDVTPGHRMLGAPAAPERDQKRVLMTLERLPEFRKDIQRIKQHLGLKDE